MPDEPRGTASHRQLSIPNLARHHSLC